MFSQKMQNCRISVAEDKLLRLLSENTQENDKLYNITQPKRLRGSNFFLIYNY